MPAYDPKRPRPAARDDQGPAPVEALLEPAEPDPAVAADPAAPEPEPPTTTAAPDSADADAVAEPAEDQPDGPATDADEPADAVPASRSVADDVEVDLRDVSSNGSGGTPHEVPVAPAPNEVTTNRAVLVAGISAAALVALIAAVLLRRRRRSD